MGRSQAQVDAEAAAKRPISPWPLHAVRRRPCGVGCVGVGVRKDPAWRLMVPPVAVQVPVQVGRSDCRRCWQWRTDIVATLQLLLCRTGQGRDCSAKRWLSRLSGYD
jgi:hypothetical protein